MYKHHTNTTLNELCRQSLSWPPAPTPTPDFCADLNLIHEHLIPNLKKHNNGEPENPEEKYTRYLLNPLMHGAGIMHDTTFHAINAPARLRVEAYLTALNIKPQQENQDLTFTPEEIHRGGV